MGLVECCQRLRLLTEILLIVHFAFSKVHSSEEKTFGADTLVCGGVTEVRTSSSSRKILAEDVFEASLFLRERKGL